MHDICCLSPECHFAWERDNLEGHLPAAVYDKMVAEHEGIARRGYQGWELAQHARWEREVLGPLLPRAVAVELDRQHREMGV